MSKSWRRTGAVAALALAFSLTGGLVATTPARAVPGGGVVRCSDKNPDLVEVKLDDAPEVGDVVTDGTLVVTITDVRYKMDDSGDTVAFSFESNLPVSVIVKGSTDTRSYYFFSPTTSGTDLFSPVKPNGTHYEISYAAFCYLPPV